MMTAVDTFKTSSIEIAAVVSESSPEAFFFVGSLRAAIRQFVASSTAEIRCLIRQIETAAPAMAWLAAID